jgi:hypothetical protein
VADHLRELESRIANQPEQAVAHLLWPCFSSTSSTRETKARPVVASRRPSRRNPIPPVEPPCSSEQQVTLSAF